MPMGDGLRRAREVHEARRNSPEAQAARLAFNRAMLKEARERYGALHVRIMPGVIAKGTPGGRQRRAKPQIWNMRTLRGATWKMVVPEPIDVWELLEDLGRFLMAWRPSRLRSEAGKAAARDCLATWERLAGS